MTLGFTDIKVDCNLCFKVKGRRLVMLLLCVDELFSRHGGVAECGWNLPWKMEVCSGTPKEVQDDGLKGHDHTYGIGYEAIEFALSESVDATMYCQMICSLMYLTNTRLDI